MTLSRSSLHALCLLAGRAITNDLVIIQFVSPSFVLPLPTYWDPEVVFVELAQHLLLHGVCSLPVLLIGQYVEPATCYPVFRDDNH